MADDERKQLQHQVRELEDYLEGLARGGGVWHTMPGGRQADNPEEAIARTKREIEALKKRLAVAR